MHKDGMEQFKRFGAGNEPAVPACVGDEAARPETATWQDYTGSLRFTKPR